MAEGESTEHGQDMSIMFKCLLKTIETRFPNVRNVSTNEAEKLLKSDSNRVVFLDVRESNEYEVSHIQNAVHVPPETEEFDNLKSVIKEKMEEDQNLKVVCYCSLGYRSSAMAQKLVGVLRDLLRKNGEKRMEILNMRGGLFQWANEGKLMNNNDGKETIYAHPYSVMWGKFLNYELRQWDIKNNL